MQELQFHIRAPNSKGGRQTVIVEFRYEICGIEKKKQKKIYEQKIDIFPSSSASPGMKSKTPAKILKFTIYR